MNGWHRIFLVVSLFWAVLVLYVYPTYRQQKYIETCEKAWNAVADLSMRLSPSRAEANREKAATCKDRTTLGTVYRLYGSLIFLALIGVPAVMYGLVYWIGQGFRQQNN